MYYEDDKRIPYYEKGRSSTYSSNEVVDILMRVREPACTEVPLQAMENASFLIYLDALVHPDDCKADDLGKWTHTGSPKSYIPSTAT